MRIHRLELHGFKSFPERTQLELGAGISCVIGPNGCGKSNILDAIKWCIGEQSAKSLRGADMLDVIFSGSQQRAAVGFAEVTMTLASDQGEPFPGEYARFSELQVGRRLHRTGASEYFINQTRCRRRDIVDLFLDTGVGSNLYSFIEQGSVGKIVHATAEERRSLIEEAAGISKYKARREEAQQRLDATAGQLDRVADVVDELDKRLRQLEGQVRKAARFRRLRARIRQIELLLALARYADLAAERRRLRKDQRDAHERTERLHRDVLQIEEDVTARREEVEVVEAGSTTWRDEVAELDARQRELDSALAFAAQRTRELDAEIARSERERVEAAAREKASRDLLVTGEEGLRTATAEREEAAAEHRVAAATWERTAADLALARERADVEERSAAELVGRREAVGRRHQELVERLQALPGRIAERERARDAGVQAATVAEQVAMAAREAIERARVAESDARRALEERTAEVAGASAAAAAVRDAAARVESERRRVSDDHARRVRDAERRVGEVEASARVRVERVEHQGRAALASAEAGERQRQQAGRAEVERAVAAARARAETWVAAERSAGEAAVAHARRLGAQHVLEARRSGEAVVEALAGEVARALAAMEAEAAAEVAARTARAEADRASAWDGVERGRADVARLHEEHAALGARLGALAARLAALAPADPVGVSADLVATLRGLPRLADLVTDPTAVAALGEQLSLPVTRDLEHVRRVLASGSPALRLLYIGEGVEPGALLSAVHRFDDVERAAAHHARTGQAVFLASGARIDAAGVVQGGASDAAAAERRRADDHARARAEHDDVAARLDPAAAALAAARQRLSEADVAARAADAAVARLQGEAAASWQERSAQQRADGAARLDAARTALERDLAEQSAAADARVLAVRDRVEATLRDCEGLRDAAVSAAREAAERIQADRAAAATAAAASERAAHEHALEALRASTAGEIAAARTALESLRAGPPAVPDPVDVEPAQEAVRGATALRDAAATHLARAEAERVVAEGEAAAAATRAVAARESAARAEILLAELRDEATRLEDEAGRLASEAEVLAASVADPERLIGARVALVAATETESAARDALRAVEIRVATLEERVAARVAASAAARQGLDDAVLLAARASERLPELRTALAAVVADRSAAEAESLSVKERRAAAWDRLQRERERLDRLRTACRALEASGLERARERDAATLAATELDASAERVRLEIESLCERIEERYQLALPGLLDRLEGAGFVRLESDPDVVADVEIGGRVLEGVPDLEVRRGALSDFADIEARVAELAELRRQLGAVGDVNLAATEEYADVRTRHDQLVAQRADLEESIAGIRSAIAKMNKTCRQRFRDTFDRVDQYFREIYPRLTGGGTGHLALTNEEDLLETGVDVFVQPPGKKLQNLHLLSGGEKAMTAIAVLLSLFRVKPSPFCVLDEVDAPLDEANGTRFNEILKEMAGIAQFILITHNRKTMECADTLYGVTMPTPGVSRLVSVRLDA